MILQEHFHGTGFLFAAVSASEARVLRNCFGLDLAEREKVFAHVKALKSQRALSGYYAL